MSLDATSDDCFENQHQRSSPINNRTIPILQEAKTYSQNEAECPYFPGMDAVRNLILERSDKLRITLAELSKQIGKNHAYLQQYVKRGVPAHLPENIRILLAPVLGVDAEELRGAGSSQQNKKHSAAPAANARVAGATRIANTIPVYGHAMGGKDGQFVLNGNKVADILAPPSLTGVPEAYAVYIVGTSMEPRYFGGEAVFVNPRLPVRKDDFVVAQIAAAIEGDPPLAYVKRYVSQDARTLKLAQFSPKKILEFPRNKVVSIHRIIMGGDG